MKKLIATAVLLPITTYLISIFALVGHSFKANLIGFPKKTTISTEVDCTYYWYGIQCHQNIGAKRLEGFSNPTKSIECTGIYEEISCK